MVAARFRALMERRERRLEEAMSDPQTRTDLEAMFPGVLDGDYQTLLAGVRGMEEDDFQELLNTARKRRREVSRHNGCACWRAHVVVRHVLSPSRARTTARVFFFLWVVRDFFFSGRESSGCRIER